MKDCGKVDVAIRRECRYRSSNAERRLAFHSALHRAFHKFSIRFSIDVFFSALGFPRFP